MDECDALIFPGAETMKTNAVSIRNYVGKLNDSALYEIDSNMKYSLTCDKDKVLYAKHPHYGWQVCTVAQTQCLPPLKVLYAREFVGKEVLLNLGGNREAQIDQDVPCNDNTILAEKIPSEYQQENASVKNSCVWLATCLVVRSVDSNLASILLRQFKENPSKFEWIPIFNRKAKTHLTLYNLLLWTSECNLTVTHIKVPKVYTGMTQTNYILTVEKEGLIVAMLIDKNGGRSHTVGLNLKKQLIYDCQERFVLKLTNENLSLCCGPLMIFDKFYVVAELR